MANRVYEVMFIVDVNVPDDEVNTLSENLQRTVTDQGGRITKAENMGRRSLAYRIGRQTEGTYVLLEIEGTGREIAELERRMRVNDQVVRYMSVRVDEDRRRAEKLRARRARKASKRPFTRPAEGRSATKAGAGEGDGA